MVRRSLKLALLAGAVLAGHLLTLAWVGHEVETVSALPEMAPPMYTRLLQPAAPPAIAAVPAKPPRARRRAAQGVLVAQRARPAASAPQAENAAWASMASASAAQAAASAETSSTQAESRHAEAAQAAASPASAAASAAVSASAAASAPTTALASAPVTPAGSGTALAPTVPPNPFAPAAAASASAVAATPAASATSTASLDTWPTDTRLDYQLTGQFRSGPLYGNATVAWQRQGAKYQVKLQVNLQPWVTEVLTSQGEVTPDGLLPHAYEELNPRKRRNVRIGDDFVTLDNGSTARRPAGVQDTASQFVELVHRFATGRETLAVGRSVTVWLARPGGVDAWIYDIADKEMLRLPRLGTVEVFHLKPRPLGRPRGDITAEMWFAPSLQYLPVRIRIAMGSEAHVDLQVEQIEQR